MNDKIYHLGDPNDPRENYTYLGDIEWKNQRIGFYKNEDLDFPWMCQIGEFEVILGPFFTKDECWTALLNYYFEYFSTYEHLYRHINFVIDKFNSYERLPRFSGDHGIFDN